MALPPTTNHPSLVDLTKTLLDHLKSQQSLHRVRGITVSANCTKIVILGTCDTFYSKQIAQELVLNFLKGCAEIQNNIFVETKKGSELLLSSDAKS